MIGVGCLIRMFFTTDHGELGRAILVLCSKVPTMDALMRRYLFGVLLGD